MIPALSRIKTPRFRPRPGLPDLRRWLVAATALAIAAVQPLQAAQEQDRLGLRIIQSGHSLTDPIVGPLRAFAIASGAGQGTIIDRSTIPGSPMEWRWDHAAMPDAKADIGNYDLLVLTERVPLSNTAPFHRSPEMALAWFEQAYRLGAEGAGAATLLYASWVEIDSGPGADNPYKDAERHIPWRERLPLEFAGWTAIADFVDANRPDGSQPMRIIPATLVLAAAADDIAAGRAPGFSELNQLFEDNVHLNDAGAYLVALAHFAIIYELDPRGLPSDIGLRRPLTEEQAAWMQELVWDVVTAYRTRVEQRQAAGGALSLAAFQTCLWADLRSAERPCS